MAVFKVHANVKMDEDFVIEVNAENEDEARSIAVDLAMEEVEWIAESVTTINKIDVVSPK